VRKGHAVLMISSELPEVLEVSDRIYVMRAGRIAGELWGAEATEEAVMRLAAGGNG
jgi:ribose transport system ATP-binding protein